MNTFNIDMSKSSIIHLDHRGQCTAPQTIHFFQGVITLLISKDILFKLQLPAEGIIYQTCTFYMAGGTRTDLDNVFSCRFQSELCIKAGYPKDQAWCDIRDITYFPQHFFRQIVIFRLYGLKDRDHRFFIPAMYIDNLFQFLI